MRATTTTMLTATSFCFVRLWGTASAFSGGGGGCASIPSAFARTVSRGATSVRSDSARRASTTSTTGHDGVVAAVSPPDGGDDDEEERRQLAALRSPFLTTMRDRGFLHQCTALAELDEALSSGEVRSAYLGFDATADSLHVGSLLQIMILRHLQRCGHKPVVLLGGATSKVGDPTGKDQSRVMLDDDAIDANVAGIRRVFEKLLVMSDDDDDDVSGSDAVMVNNDDWLGPLKYLDFLRDYGSQFTVNRMLSFESVKQRLDRDAPFSFLEFNYMILQAYDFLELSRSKYEVKLQLGGSDQWGNIVSGTELGRRCDGTKLFGLTAPLVTTSDGKKMGKTAAGAVWLNEDRLSAFDYWQFWRNTDDADVVRFLKLFTELPLDEIDALSKLEGAGINAAKEVLADEATSLLHGADALPAIKEAAARLFGGGGGGAGAASTESMPRVVVSADALAADDGLGGGAGVKFLDLFLEIGFAKSKKEARRLISGGGARLNDVKITDENGRLTAADFPDGDTEVTLRAGKKRAGVVELTQ